MVTKQEAIAQIIRIMQEQSIQLSEIKESLAIKTETKQSSIFKKFFAYVGAIFILSGLGIYVGQHWLEMNSAARIIITLGTGIVFYILALSATKDMRYSKAATPLFLLAALFEATGMFVTIHELFPLGNDPRYAELIVFGTLFLQQLLTFLNLQRTVLVFITLIFGFAFIAVTFDIMALKSAHISIVIGLSLLLISFGLAKTPHASITPFWYFVGSVIFLCGFFDIIRNTPFEILYLGVSIFMIYVSTLVRSRMLLFTSAIAMVAYIGYFTTKHFVGSIGWPLALIFFGFILLGISAITVKIGKTIR